MKIRALYALHSKARFLAEARKRVPHPIAQYAIGWEP